MCVSLRNARKATLSNLQLLSSNSEIPLKTLQDILRRFPGARCFIIKHGKYICAYFHFIALRELPNILAATTFALAVFAAAAVATGE